MSGSDPRDEWREAEDPEAPRSDELSWPARDVDDPADAPDAVALNADAPNSPPVEDPAAAAEGPEAPAHREGPWDPRRYGERRRATTAEQAVPWLIGLVLALAGIVIVLLALIFTDTSGGFGAIGSESPFAASQTGAPSQSASLAPSGSPSPSASATPRPTPPPTYGALEMLYLSRPGGTGTSQLFRDDFATSAGARVIARASVDITHDAVSPDGTESAAIVGGKLLAYASGKPSRTLVTEADAVTFGADASTVYAVSISRSGATDTATVWAVPFASGGARKLTTISFPHPATPPLSNLGIARFFDDGGTYRLYATSDGNLVFWVSRAGQWRIDPSSGAQVAVSRQPILWSPDGSRRIAVSESGQMTTLAVLDTSGKATSQTSITGLTSHLRWSPHLNRIVFTLGRSLPGGGVEQDLYTWDLVNGRAPIALTTNGASFGADWLGVAQFWQP